MTRTRQYFAFLALPIATFLACTIFLQTKKTPWVDECYTYYGITHENWGQFIDSICSGVNFSPPLYFFLNWIIQLVFHLPIEVLRVESALWISLGSFFVFIKCAKSFSTQSAFLGCMLVLLQSDLLLDQALEARHYGMFFACSAWVLLLFPNNHQFTSKSHITLYFLAHLALSYTHYLGIIFSALTGFARYWHQRKKSFTESLPIPEVISLLLALPIYLLLLRNQSSHLGNWPKPNSLATLLDIYCDSLSPLSLIIPFLLFLTFVRLRKKLTVPNGIPLIIVVSITWLLTPIFFWIISHTFDFNLLKDRYFIPKEGGVMILLSYFFYRIIPTIRFYKLSSRRMLFPLGGTFLFCVCLTLLISKRKLYGFDPSINYYSRLLSSERIINNKLPKLYFGDHLFFPNKYFNESTPDIRLRVQSEKLVEVYKRFNPSIKTQTLPESKPQSYILIVERKMLSSGSRNISPRKEIETNGLITSYEITVSNQI